MESGAVMGPTSSCNRLVLEAYARPVVGCVIEIDRIVLVIDGKKPGLVLVRGRCG